MNKNRIREIFSDDKLTLYAVESVEVTHNKTAAGFTWHGKVKPAAIIIDTPEKKLALDMDASSIEIEKLKESIPELGSIIS